MFGKLTLDAVPYHEPIIVVTVAAIIIGGRPSGLITYFGKWSYLWNEWLTSVDHKTRYHVLHRRYRHVAAWLC
jgi:cytochrome o ubiquinol oxidase subunit 1